MKKIILILGLLFLIGCTSTKFVDTWRNKEVTTFKPTKLLVVGITDQLTARKIFEEELTKAFTLRGINASEGSTVFNKAFTDSKKSEKEIDDMIKGVSDSGYNAILITALKGVDEKRNYSAGYYDIGYSWRRFGRYYYWYQDIYYNPSYYDTYKVYHVETSIYNLNENEDKSLVWVGSLAIVNPQTITTTVKSYVANIIKQLERENLINKL
jgi:hypothetical protein